MTWKATCAFATAAAGLSPIVGALIAGIVIAETEYGNEVEATIEPFKGLALGIFLLSVGMMLDLRMILEYWPQLLGAVVAGIYNLMVKVTGGLLVGFTSN